MTLVDDTAWMVFARRSPTFLASNLTPARFAIIWLGLFMHDVVSAAIFGPESPFAA